MKKNKSITFLLLFVFTVIRSGAQSYPIFGPPIPVTINGLSFDAMEPHLSYDGNILFFNNANDGINTGLYYATRVNDSTFNYMGPLDGANQTAGPRLDAVASIDMNEHFYWISTRDYPTEFDNVFHGGFTGSDVTGIGRVHGNFYIYVPGWLIMDAAISYDGQHLYYTNAYLSGCGGLPCSAALGIAQKVNDSTFNKLPGSDSLLKYVNDTGYVVYAPCITHDGLELYFSRFPSSGFTYTQICVSVRASVTDTFSLPMVIESSALVPEASTLTTDKSRMYYHRTDGSLRRIFLRYRTGTVGIQENSTSNPISVFPNPAGETVFVTGAPEGNFKAEIFSMPGKKVSEQTSSGKINLGGLLSGEYILRISTGKNVYTTTLIKKQ